MNAVAEDEFLLKSFEQKFELFGERNEKFHFCERKLVIEFIFIMKKCFSFALNLKKRNFHEDALF